MGAEIDFREKTLLHYGPAKFQISGDDNKELRSAHCFLFEDLFLITQKSNRTKKFETKVIETKVKAEGYIYYPIIKVDPYRMRDQRNNALALNFYMIVSGEVSMIMDFQAITKDDRNYWVDRISDQLEINKPMCQPVPPRMRGGAGTSSLYSLRNNSTAVSDENEKLLSDFENLTVSDFTEKINSVDKSVLLEVLQKTIQSKLSES